MRIDPPGPPLRALPGLLRKLAVDRLGMMRDAAGLGESLFLGLTVGLMLGAGAPVAMSRLASTRLGSPHAVTESVSSATSAVAQERRESM